VIQAVPFLKQYNIRGFGASWKEGRRHRGGNAAIDAARTALRLEAEEVPTIVYRRTKDHMPAYAEVDRRGSSRGGEAPRSDTDRSRS
jgi:NADH-quinone oxidoreductase subunit F